MPTLVTGANGFVGSALCETLRRHGRKVREAVRSGSETSDIVSVGSICGSTDWTRAVHGCDVVIHLAARVHIMNDTDRDPLQAFREGNLDGTLTLAEQAAESGVGRFIFISSIKVNGEETVPDRPFRADDKANPSDPYGISKHEAEVALQQLAMRTGMEVVCIRPVLVYGPGVRANFLSMMRWLQRGFPLPLGSIENSRSLVALDNLIDLIATCIDHRAAANQTFLVSDGEDISTTALLYRMGKALGRPAMLIPVPSWLLKACATIIGKRAVARRLLDSLSVDIGKTRSLLGWKPPLSVDEGLQRTAEHYLVSLEK